MAPPLSEEERAAIKVQALVRGRSGRNDFALVRDEEACRQWISYYVALGQFEDAEELGWDGVDPAPPTKEELEANLAAMEEDEGSKADAPSETTQQGASTRGEQLYEEATRSRRFEGGGEGHRSLPALARAGRVERGGCRRGCGWWAARRGLRLTPRPERQADPGGDSRADLGTRPARARRRAHRAARTGGGRSGAGAA